MKPKTFAQFYRQSVFNFNCDEDMIEYQEACGDRSVLILDGREHESSHHGHAKRWAKTHGYDAYRLCYGTFTKPNYLTNIIPV